MLLQHRILQAEGASPRQAIMFLHGILGRGSNWQSFARRLVRRRPEWAAVLVDLRLHGGSQGFEPPHTLMTAADDVGRVTKALPLPVRAVLGHSFGGKVALTWLRHVAVEHAPLYGQLHSAWLIDSPPGARGAGEGDFVRQVFATLQSVRGPWPKRAHFVAELEQAGIAHGTAVWLAQNLERTSQGFALALDLDALEGLLDDHYRADLWPAIEVLAEALPIHMVVGGKSSVFIPSERARADGYARAGKVQLTVLEKAGHWVHTDDPAGLLECLVQAL